MRFGWKCGGNGWKGISRYRTLCLLNGEMGPDLPFSRNFCQEGFMVYFQEAEISVSDWRMSQ